MERSELAIVIPAWNEEKSIARVVQSVLLYGIAIVVNDKSSDNTAQYAQDAGANVVNHIVNKGYDGALNSGFKRASELGCKYIITFDADGQHDFKLIPTFCKLFEEGNDLVVGIRPKAARFGEFVFSVVTQIRFGLKDPLCGMKGYRIEVYNKRGFFDSCKSIGTELTIWALRNKYKLAQLPIPIHDREGQSRFGKIIRANYMIITGMIRVLRVTKER
ncbi:MAG: glycosyltransferase family 2 protein [Fibrobacter sp.]|nr:glycosyltransferase family 2 protein [Fibrobacter sp.]